MRHCSEETKKKISEALKNKSQEERDEINRKHRETEVRNGSNQRRGSSVRKMWANKSQEEKDEINRKRLETGVRNGSDQRRSETISETLKNKPQEEIDESNRKHRETEKNKSQEEKDLTFERQRKGALRRLSGRSPGYGGTSFDRWENVQQWFFKLARDLRILGFGDSYFDHFEYEVAGYKADFYNKEAGLVIEADNPKDRRKFNRDGSLTEKARKRQSRIEERLNLNYFIRWYKGDDLEKREQEILESIRRNVMISA